MGLSIAILLLSTGLAQFGGSTGGGTESVTRLAKKSDLILVGTIQSITADSSADVVQLSVDRVLQGTMGFREVTVRFQTPFKGSMPKEGLLPRRWVGTTGLWFLHASGSAFQVMPLAFGVYWPGDAFLPVAANSPEPPGGNIDRQLLRYVTEWYQSLPHPDRAEDDRFLAYLVSADKTDALAAVDPLIGSTSPDQAAIGVTAAIQDDPEDGLVALSSHIDVIQGSSKMSRIPLQIVVSDRSKSETELPAIQSLASKHLAVPDLDSALAGRLVQIGGKNVLPVMALLTDSRDAQVKRRAAVYIAHFTGDSAPPNTSRDSILFWVGTQSISR